MNLFSNLFHWAHRQDENFLTESFACVANYLLKEEREAGIDLLAWLCFGETSDSRFDGKEPVLSLQHWTEQGVPDMKVETDSVLVFIEVKKGSGLGHRQLERYRGILESSKHATKNLILLTLYQVEFDERSERPDRQLTWHDVGEYLRNYSEFSNPVSQFLVQQFIEFLEQQRMSVQRVERDYISGMQAYVRLVTMIDHAVDVAEIAKYKRPRNAKGFWIFYVGSTKSRDYSIRFYYEEPTKLRFEFYNKRHDPEQLDSYPAWNAGGKSPHRIMELDEEFFGLDAQRQLGVLAEFFRSSYAEAKRLELRE